MSSPIDRAASSTLAVAGASTNVDSPGHDYVKSLQVFGFAGAVYPINPRADKVAGLKAYPSLLDVPGEVDLVISCVPASAVLDLIGQCGEKGVAFVVEGQLAYYKNSETNRESYSIWAESLTEITPPKSTAVKAS